MFLGASDGAVTAPSRARPEKELAVLAELPDLVSYEASCDFTCCASCISMY